MREVGIPAVEGRIDDYPHLFSGASHLQESDGFTIPSNRIDPSVSGKSL
ncbi:hypothetical protein [Jiella pacifica]|uniref:Uncharacterized protein n=1 Tax=Jiella pacifica TaxID=2696469 RepID=A0A6N9T325_9HYPH|nr:hypothetical protein [Jiella pacifica]NDW04982.1 hypothetical protein [Jiella pacifica]